MKIRKSLGMILLGIWLIVTGLITFIPAIAISIVTIILAVIAIVAGLLILFAKNWLPLKLYFAKASLFKEGGNTECCISKLHSMTRIIIAMIC